MERFRAAPGSAPAEGLGLYTGGRPEAPARGAGLAQPGCAPARAPTRPSLVRLLVQRLHVAGPAGSLPRNTSSQSRFRLPASGRRPRPLLPARVAPTRALLVVVATEEEGTGRRGPEKKAKCSQGAAAGRGRGSLVFGGGRSSASSQALTRAVGEDRREALRARLAAGQRVHTCPALETAERWVWRFHSSLEFLTQASPMSNLSAYCPPAIYPSNKLTVNVWLPCVMCAVGETGFPLPSKEVK